MGRIYWIYKSNINRMRRMNEVVVRVWCMNEVVVRVSCMNEVVVRDWRINEVVVRDWCEWLNQEIFLKT